MEESESFFVQDMKMFGQNWPEFQYDVCRVMGFTIANCDASWRVAPGRWTAGD